MEFKHFQGPNFVLSVPTNWFISSTVDFQAIFLSQPKEDSTRANLTVSVRQLEEGSTLEGVVIATRQEQAKSYAQYETLEEIDYTATGGTGFQHRYRWIDPEQDMMIVQEQAFFFVEPMLFTLTGTCILQHADEYVPVFKQMIDSLRL